MYYMANTSTLFDNILNNIVEPKSGVAMLNNIVDNIQQCWQQNIVQSCLQKDYHKLFVFCCADKVSNVVSLE